MPIVISNLMGLPGDCSRQKAIDDQLRRADERRAWDECRKRRNAPGYENMMAVKGKYDPLTGEIKK